MKSENCGRRNRVQCSFCAAAIQSHTCLLRVNCTYYRAAALLSASPQLAEPIHAGKRFRVVPTADACIAANNALFDHLVSACKQRRRHYEAKRLGSVEIDHQFVLGRRLYWQVGYFSSKYPPAEPGALGYEPLKAAVGGR
jgi:hypothetical protein